MHPLINYTPYYCANTVLPPETYIKLVKVEIKVIFSYFLSTSQGNLLGRHLEGHCTGRGKLSEEFLRWPSTACSALVQAACGAQIKSEDMGLEWPKKLSPPILLHPSPRLPEEGTGAALPQLRPVGKRPPAQGSSKVPGSWTPSRPRPGAVPGHSTWKHDFLKKHINQS